MSIALEQKKHLTNAPILKVAIRAAVVQVLFVNRILVSALNNILLQLYYYNATTDISRECADDDGTPPQNQSKIANIERYLLQKTNFYITCTYIISAGSHLLEIGRPNLWCIFYITVELLLMLWVSFAE